MALKSDEQFKQLPSRIIETIMSDYLYADVFNGYKRFFNEDVLGQKNFLKQLAMGLMPRRFDSSNKEDKIIYEENQEVSELYLVIEGKVSIAINAFSNKSNASFYKVCFATKGK